MLTDVNLHFNNKFVMCSDPGIFCISFLISLVSNNNHLSPSHYVMRTVFKSYRPPSHSKLLSLLIDFMFFLSGAATTVLLHLTKLLSLLISMQQPAAA